MASSLSRWLVTKKLPQNPSLNPWLSASQTISYPRLPSDGNPFRFFNASSFFSTSRFPALIPTAPHSNFLRSFPICASENPPFHKPEPSNKAIPVVKLRSNTPTFFKPYWVSSQTSYLAMPTALNPDSTRHFFKSRSRPPQNQNLRNPQNPKVESVKPLPRDRILTPNPLNPFVAPRKFQCVLNPFRCQSLHRLSSHTTHSSGEEEEEEESEEEESFRSASKYVSQIGKTTVEKAQEASEIGYRVVGPLDLSENPFKPYEPVFAVVQFKVSNGDSIHTERLKFCEVNDKLILNRVLMLGSQTQTLIGRPILTDAAVHAIVEEHALDAKVIIFKKKRRKNYRRTKGHRQGIEKPQNVAIAA